MTKQSVDEAAGRPKVVLLYAVNGRGIGHIARLRAIVKRIQKVVEQRKQDILFFLVSSSDEAHLMQKEGVLVFKVPSEHCIGATEGLEYPTIASAVISEIIVGLAPDLIVVDGSPFGAFGELDSTNGKDLLAKCRRRAYIFRPVQEKVRCKSGFSQQLDAYDGVIIPEEQSHDASIMLPDMLKKNILCWLGNQSRNRRAAIERD